jgi:hypothetical protein
MALLEVVLAELLVLLEETVELELGAESKGRKT